MAIIRVPYKADGTPLDSDPVAGYGRVGDHNGCSTSGEHNGSECGVVRTGTSVVELDGIPWYWQNYVDHENGTYGLWLKFIQDPSCKVKESGLYADGGVPGAGYNPDADTLVKLNKYWDVGECGTEGPQPVTNNGVEVTNDAETVFH